MHTQRRFDFNCDHLQHTHRRCATSTRKTSGILYHHSVMEGQPRDCIVISYKEVKMSVFHFFAAFEMPHLSLTDWGVEVLLSWSRPGWCHDDLEQVNWMKMPKAACMKAWLKCLYISRIREKADHRGTLTALCLLRESIHKSALVQSANEASNMEHNQTSDEAKKQDLATIKTRGTISSKNLL